MGRMGEGVLGGSSARERQEGGGFPEALVLGQGSREVGVSRLPMTWKSLAPALT